MGILDRYVFRQAAGALALILVSLTGVTWIAVALRQLDLVTGQGQNGFLLLKMTTLALPQLVALIAPIALLIAATHVLNRLNGDSELIVMTAGGAPVWQLLKPLLILAVLVSAVVAFVNHEIGPGSQRKLRDYALQVRTDLIAQVIQPGRFTTPEANLTLHIRDRSPNGELLGLLIHDARDPKQASSYLAERGRLVKQGDAAYLMMQNGHIVRRAEGEAAPQIIVFDRYAIDITRLEQKADQALVLKPRERYTSELIWVDRNDPAYKAGPGRFKSELHERFAGPLYPFAFIFIALALVGQARTTRQNRLQGVVMAFALSVGARVLGIAAANMAAVRPSAIPLMYAIPVGAMVLAAVACQRNMTPRPLSRFARWQARTLDSFVDAAGRLARLVSRRPLPAPAER